MHMSVQNSLAGITVRDLAAATRWYENLLSKPPDQKPMPEVAEWAFPRGGWIQVFADPDRAGKSSVTFSVSDLKTQADHLRSLGIAVGDLQESKQVKTLIIRDPDGNQLVFAEPLTADMAHQSLPPERPHRVMQRIAGPSLCLALSVMLTSFLARAVADLKPR
jgi:catechol 2,3-dioxygenase-like lactoylglutathione lyase family enzyme